MKVIRFSHGNRSNDVLHIEIPGAIVNIRVNLRDATGREVSSVSISPEDASRGGDVEGRIWDLVIGNGPSVSDGAVARLVRRDAEPES